ncbi:PHB depolymerase esterase [Massilia sp. Root351]|jgi:poly(hydroxyalkanoate) depolymerase family esterase|uniref:extracellular catalytic domain type 1 short-chain-length polyhydroxyalkanoate depolymerase n=1 Tax=Massilia sp. Root351 TaxID=1736522 RepID=UPI00070A7E33|nr:PHB depolymerase family esterase [Massilia sp. Root351]KQV80279.1 PHB depolymerase esterase [Massilia sp. Root351]
MLLSPLRTRCIRLLAVLALALPAAAPAWAGQWDFGVYANLWGIREYQVWLPTGYSPGTPLPVVLMLHGCGSEPNSMAAVSRYNELADRERFIVLYPRQNASANPSRCWNFMLEINQQRGSGEPSQLMGMLNAVKGRYSVDGSRVYVTGISAGGAMAAIMAACYSDVFAAVMVHSGGMYKGATGLLTAAESLLQASPYDPALRGKDAWRCSGSPRRLMPAMVFHGTADIVVNPANGDQTIEQFLQTSDWGDDGADNDSVAYRASSIGRYTVPYGRSYTVDSYTANGVLVAQKYTVAGMNHAWSGGPPGWPFSDELGPDATAISWAFFRNYRR